MNWYIGPYVLAPFQGSSCWRAPVGTVGIDLRTIPQQSTYGSEGFGAALFFGDLNENRSDYTLIGTGSWNEIQPAAAIRNRLGANLIGDTLAEILESVLTGRADPEGLSAPRPIMPTVEGMAELHLGGSRRAARMRWNSQHGINVRQLLKQDFASMWESDVGNRRQSRKVLDYWRVKYKLDWREFVPAKLLAHVEGPLPHETTISDNFDRANSTTTLGTASGGFTYNVVAGTWGINDNAAYCPTASGWSPVQAASDLSSTDHYSQVTIASAVEIYEGPACRVSNSATTFYQFSAAATQYLFKLVAGTQTVLTSTTGGYIADQVWKCEANGSTIKGYINGSTILTATDSAISSGVRAGFAKYDQSSFGCFKDFTAADLVTVNYNAQQQNNVPCGAF